MTIKKSTPIPPYSTDMNPHPCGYLGGGRSQAVSENEALPVLSADSQESR